MCGCQAQQCEVCCAARVADHNPLATPAQSQHVHARVSIGEASGCRHVLGCEAQHGTPEALLAVCSMFVKR